MMRGEAARRRGAAGRVTPREAEGTEGGGGCLLTRVLPLLVRWKRGKRGHGHPTTFQARCAGGSSRPPSLTGEGQGSGGGGRGGGDDTVLGHCSLLPWR